MSRRHLNGGGQPARGVAALAAAIAIGSSATASVMAASPSPSANSSEPPSIVEVRLDAVFITPDAPPGGRLEAGFTFWDVLGHRLTPMDDIYARMHPQVGDAAPSEGAITVDFPGHIVVDFVVPEGGPGDVEVGAHAQGCDSSGKCANLDVPFDLVGIGPPPEAPAFDLVTATFHDFIGDIVADRPFPVSVDINPRGQWQVDEVPVPQVLDVIASRPGEPQLATTTILRGSEPGAPYSGHLTIPGLGDATLSVFMRTADGTAQVIPGEAATVTVVKGGRPSPTPAASSPAPAAGVDLPPVVPLAGLAILTVVAAFQVRRMLRDR